VPVEVTTNAMDRMVVAVASGNLTLEDLVALRQGLLKADHCAYRKIVEINTATTTLDEKTLSGLATFIMRAESTTPCGPLAIVTTADDAGLAHMFAALTTDKRPARVFRSIHEARRWLDGQGPRRR
jgi:hypothetical protein